MKKLISLIMTLIMLFSMSVISFAEEGVDTSALESAIALYEQTDFSAKSRVATLNAMNYYKKALDVLENPESTQTDVDRYAVMLNSVFNASPDIARDSVDSVGYSNFSNGRFYIPRFSSDGYNIDMTKPYYEWNMDLGYLKINLGEQSDSLYNIKSFWDFVEGTMYYVPWKVYNRDVYLRDLFIPDNIYVEEKIFYKMRYLRSIVLLGENIKNLDPVPSYTASDPIIVYGICDAHRQYAENNGCEYRDLHEYSFAPSEQSGVRVWNDTNLFTGIEPMTNSQDLAFFDFETSACYVVPIDGSKRVSTGTQFNIVKWLDDSVAETYTAVIYGDVDGDGVYDATDAYKVNLIINGWLTREQVGEAAWAAADCNHDGVIDSL
ncbi:MAG: dockerin type I repeat-containing protein, partial [Acutalibacteraceae bacterium]